MYICLFCGGEGVRVSDFGFRVDGFIGFRVSTIRA